MKGDFENETTYQTKISITGLIFLQKYFSLQMDFWDNMYTFNLGF